MQKFIGSRYRLGNRQRGAVLVDSTLLVACVAILCIAAIYNLASAEYEGRNGGSEQARTQGLADSFCKASGGLHTGIPIMYWSNKAKKCINFPPFVCEQYGNAC